MHFAVEGTLWVGAGPDLYDQMAGKILRGLAGKGLDFTFLGKEKPLSFSSLGPVAPSLKWKRVDEKVADRIHRDPWLRRAVPRAIRDGQMEGWISWEGHGLEEDLPQWLFIKEVSGLLWPAPEGPSKVFDRKFRARWEAAFRHSSTGILTFSERAASILKESYGLREGAVRVVPAFYPSTFPLASWDERELVKKDLSGGKEYFLWTGSLREGSHWMEALKAFSLFKKSQKSHMRLLMAPFESPDKAFLTSLSSYKYRDEVTVIDPGNGSWERALKAAYAVLYLPVYDELGWFPGLTMELEVPLISTGNSVAREWAESAVLWVQGGSPESISAAMSRIYKDEAFRSRLIEGGRGIAEARNAAVLTGQYEQVLTSTPGQ